MPSSSTSTTTTKARKPPHPNHHNQTHPASSPLLCRHHSLSATATLDLLILILVLISVTFLLTSYFSYLFTSLTLLLPSLPLPSFHFHFPLALALPLALFAAFFLIRTLFSVFRPRRCERPGCKGMKKALEFDLQLQTEDCVGAEYVDKLPWKGGTESNPDYECLRAELRKMAPVNGRAVLLFRAKCGCPIAKLVASGPKKGRKHKKASKKRLYLDMKCDRCKAYIGDVRTNKLHDFRVSKALANVAGNGDHR